MKKPPFYAVLLLLVARSAWAQTDIQTDASQPDPNAVPTTLFPTVNPSERTPATLTPATLSPSERRRLHGQHRRNSQYATDAAMSQANLDPIDVRIAYRKDKTMAVLRDPDLVAILRNSDQQPTDDLKRAGLRNYYTRLYRDILKLDKSKTMKAHIALLSIAAEQRYDPKRRSLADEANLEGVGRHNRR